MLLMRPIDYQVTQTNMYKLYITLENEKGQKTEKVLQNVNIEMYVEKAVEEMVEILEHKDLNEHCGQEDTSINIERPE